MGSGRMGEDRRWTGGREALELFNPDLPTASIPRANRGYFVVGVPRAGVALKTVITESE